MDLKSVYFIMVIWIVLFKSFKLTALIKLLDSKNAKTDKSCKITKNGMVDIQKCLIYK